MARIAKISPLRKEYSNTFNTIDQQLAKNGYYRSPGTAITVLPHKEISGKYRTGLDVDAPYLNNLSEEDKAAEIERITKDKARLEKELGIEGKGILDPTSPFYNFAASSSVLKERFGSDIKVVPIKLGTDDLIFNLEPGEDTMKEIAWNWLSVNPRIAPSLDAYKQGKVPPDVQYYIADDEAENKDKYRKNKAINEAVAAFDALTPTKRKQVARLMGLPVTEETKEEVVYNHVNDTLKIGEFRDGPHKGTSTIRLFTELLKTTDERLTVKDLVEQAITHSIYRIGVGNKVMEGEVVASPSKEDMIEHLLKTENQMELLALQKKLNNKKIK